MPHRHAVALHVVRAQGRRVEQQVDQVVVQQVDLVHVQDAPVRRGEQARLEGRDALGERPPEVKRPGEPVLGRADRQFHQPGRPPLRRAVRGVRPVRASRVGRAGEQENRQPATTSTGGSTAVSARTAVDFAVPFSPRTSTPPIAGEMALRISASRMSSIATTALNGNWVNSPHLHPAGVRARRQRRPPGNDPTARTPMAWLPCALESTRYGSQWRDRPGFAPEFLGGRSPVILSQWCGTL